ncbi:MAG: VCBS repeat-containing protein [Acidobacteria bacterium]|nr:VCBS repeat-containing protein [Acidobacteriota bacterium]
MRFTKVNLGQSDILGRKTLSPAAELERWRRNLGYLSVFAGAAAIIASQSSQVAAKENQKAIPPRIAKQASELVQQLKRGACSKPDLLRRQSEYRLPGQKSEFNMLEVFTGGDNCPGTTIPSGTYTAATPFTDSGTTAGANNTVGTARINATIGCIEGYAATYSSAMAPDHIYTFTLSARGANPRITVTPGNATYDTSVYILNSSGTACPAGTGNTATNCLVGTDVNFDNTPEIINATKMNSLPLGVPLYLFVDSFYAANTPPTTNSGPYTVTMQDVTVGSGPMPPANISPLDMNADGKTDYVLLRNIGGGTSGQVRWHTAYRDGDPVLATDWGIASDQFFSDDYDGDGQADFGVFRPSTGTFYLVRSLTHTMYMESFGQNGDDATVVGDYDGDGRADLALYRGGATPADQSFWYYRPLGGGGFTTIPWGQGGDTPAPGDYDGDGKNDFVIQRDDANGVNGRFWKRMATGAQSSEMFGLKTDTVVTGDFDDDGKSDVAVVRADGANIRWEFEPSATAGTTLVSDLWGVAATDYVTPGDYDGDGRTDYAVWREGTPGRFYIMTVGVREITTSGPWGQMGDVPAADFMVH